MHKGSKSELNMSKYSRIELLMVQKLSPILILYRYGYLREK